MKPWAADEATRSSSSGGARFSAAAKAVSCRPGSSPGGSACGFQCADAGQAAERDGLLPAPGARVAQLHLGGVAAELGRGDRPQLGGDLERGQVDGRRAHAGEARRVVPRGHAPGARRGVQLGEHVDVGGLDAERVGDHLRADRAVALALRRRPDPDGDAAERGDDHGRALGVARLGQRLGALLRGLDERDVAHVRDRGLDDAGDADPDEPARRPAPRPARRGARRSGRARARRRGRPRSRRSRRGRPTACGTGTRRPGSGCAAAARPGRGRASPRPGSSPPRARGRAAARRSRG